MGRLEKSSFRYCVDRSHVGIRYRVPIVFDKTDLDLSCIYLYFLCEHHTDVAVETTS